MVGSDLSSLDKLKEDGNLKEILRNPQDIIKSNLIKDREGLKGNVRNTREIIGDPGLNLETNLKKGNQDSDGDEYLGIPSNYPSNSDENLVENLDRKAREIQGPFLSNSDGVLGQNINENNAEGSVENGQTIKGGAQRNVRDTENPSLVGSDMFNQNLNKNEDENVENRGRFEREASNESEDEEKSDKRGVREISDERGILESKFSRQNFENLDLNSENLEKSPGILDPTLFTDDESLVGDNMRNIRDVRDNKIVENESKMGGRYMNNFEREVEEIQNGIQDMKPSLSNQENTDVHRNARETSDLSREMNLELSSDEMVEEKRNAREIPNSSRKLDLGVSKGDDDDIGNNRNVRQVSEGFGTNFPNVLSSQTCGNLRNIKGISAENSNIASNPLNQGVISDKSRNTQETPVVNPSFTQNSLNQGSNFEEPLNIREIFFKNPGFNPDIFKREPVIIGENRNIREISVENTGLNLNVTKVEPLVDVGDRVVNDVSVDSQGLKSDFTNKEVGNEDLGGEIDVKREARSCKKKISHHKNNTDEDFVYEKPPPLHASLQMMNVRIVKSKDDSKLLDDDTDSSGNTGGEKEGKKKKKKICRVKHLHVLQPLKNSKIVEAPKKKLNILSGGPGETILKVLEATMDGNNEREEEEEEEEEEGEKEGVRVVDKERGVKEESKVDEDTEEEEEDRDVANENKVKNKISRKFKLNLDRNNLKGLKDRGRLEGRIISSPLVAENLPKRVFGGTKKFVLSENRSKNYVPKSRKSLFKKERLKHDDPTFLVGVEVKKKLKNKMEDDGENDDDFENVDSFTKVEEHLDEPCQSVVETPGKFEILKLKDLQNFSEAINASDSRRKYLENKLYHFKKKIDNSFRNLDRSVDNKPNNMCVKNYSNNLDKNRNKLDMGKVEPEVLGDEEEEEEGEVEEEEEVEGESEEEERGLKRREKDDESGEGENVGVEKVGVESDEFEEKADMEEVNDMVNGEVNEEVNDIINKEVNDNMVNEEINDMVNDEVNDDSLSD
ncbi:transcriptional regulator ATRX isoform X3 [Nilaparvata lugens]|uniref:transcriptional regulator ATRX isoform X3 n=1 Tax=Nilaparvata lugens TaxID=108931 RepID=UPI00193CB1D7|nr:transcriptional regulator ATRX isoform X3 [Nilaparvata lugens]